MQGLPLSLQGLASAPKQAPVPQQQDPDTDPSNPDYEGPEDGPFQCANCSNFDGQSTCARPEVQAAIPNGQVDPGGCCKFFDSLSAGTNG